MPQSKEIYLYATDFCMHTQLEALLCVTDIDTDMSIRLNMSSYGRPLVCLLAHALFSSHPAPASVTSHLPLQQWDSWSSHMSFTCFLVQFTCVYVCVCTPVQFCFYLHLDARSFPHSWCFVSVCSSLTSPTWGSATKMDK